MAQDNFADEAREAIENQIGELRAQMQSLTKSLKDNGFDLDHLRDEASDMVSGATKNLRKATEYAQDEAKAVARVARKNPAGVSTALTLAVGLGFAFGYALCQIQHESHHTRRWWEV